MTAVAEGYAEDLLLLKMRLCLCARIFVLRELICYSSCSSLYSLLHLNILYVEYSR